MDQLALLRAALSRRYEIDQEIGRGGMATVYRAQDLRYARAVAIKVLHPALTSDLGPERFAREIKVVAGLTHPHILPLFDSGEAGGLLYYVMPYIAGESLGASLAKSGPLPVARAARMARAVALALDYAHRHGVVHRDIKPDNVLLLDGEPIVTDFGIARPLAPEPAELLTQHGLLVGTPAYMSPEQAAGEVDIDGRSDLYSLGCMLYEMLAGHQPFTGSGARAVMAKQITERPPSLRLERPDVPEGLDRVVLKALEKEPGDRYASGAEFGEVLSPWTTFSATHAAPDPAPVTAARASIAVLPFLSVSTDPENELFADGVADEITTALLSIEELRVTSRSSAYSFRGKGIEPAEAGRRLGVAHVLTGSVRKAGNKIRVTAELLDVARLRVAWSEHFDRELADVFAIQDEIAAAIVLLLRVRLLGLPGPALARRHPEDVQIYTLYLKGRYAWNKRTPDSLRRSLEFFGEALDRDPGYALAYAGQADVYNVLGWWSDVSPGMAFPRAMAASRKALELDPSLAEVYASLAFARLFYEWDWTGAEQGFRQSIARGPSYPTARQWYAQLLAARGRHEEAAAEIRQALALDPLSLIINITVPLMHYFAREYDTAIGLALRTLDLDPGFGVGHWNVGLSYQQTGRMAQAIASFRTAISLSPFKTTMTATLGHALAQSGDLAGARSILADFAQEATHRYVSPLDRALVHTGLGEHDLAFQCLDQARAERSSRMIFLGVEPMFDALRPDPRFAALLERLGLAPGDQASSAAKSEKSGSGRSL
jgi:serine/threonine-protein kinase